MFSQLDSHFLRKKTCKSYVKICLKVAQLNALKKMAPGWRSCLCHREFAARSGGGHQTCEGHREARLGQEAALGAEPGDAEVAEVGGVACKD